MSDFRITLSKYLYSASVCVKSASPTVPKLNYIVQYFMFFPMMYSKLRHKLTNVKMTRINKVIIAFVYRITLWKHTYSATVLCKICLLYYSKTQQYCAVFHPLSNYVLYIAHKLTNVKITRINKVLSFVYTV